MIDEDTMTKGKRKARNMDEAARIGQRVRVARVAAGVSQEALGEVLGITFQQVQKYEKGMNRIATDRIQKIADTVGTTVSVLLGIDDVQEDTSEHSKLMELMSTRQGHRLVHAFAQLSVTQRNAFVNLVEEFAA
jgi:transcriptional regulator with XRE-family HTH domain